MTQSLAFWIENSIENREKQPVIELHFNYWHLYDEKVNYLDVGILLKGKDKLFNSINVYLPFNYNEKSYIDSLGDKITESEKLLSAIFNNDVKSITPIRECSAKHIIFSDLDNNNEILFFTNLSHGTSENRVSIQVHSENGKHGTIIKFSKLIFNCQSKHEAKNWYFRFRYILEGKDLENISREYKSKDSIITHYFEKSEIVDFRVNESRNLPKTIREKIATCRDISNIHFFLIRNESSEFKMGHTAYNRCRILEENVWNDYLFNQGEKIRTRMLIYQWKTNAHTHVECFSAFARFLTRNVGKKEVSWIILWIVFLGTVSSLLATNIIYLFS